MEENTNTKIINTTTDTTTSAAPENKALPQEELEKLIAAEADRRVSLAQSRWKKDSEKQVSEATKLAKMSEEQKYEFQIKQREDAIAAKERELAVSANKVECLKIMAEKKLPAELVDYVVSEDAEEMSNRIKLLERVINRAVADEVKSRLGNNVPKTGSMSASITLEQFRKMSLAEQAKLAATNPELYKEFAYK